MFPDQEIQDIYQKYQVDKCYLYQNLTDTDSTSMVFFFFFFFLQFKLLCK